MFTVRAVLGYLDTVMEPRGRQCDALITFFYFSKIQRIIHNSLYMRNVVSRVGSRAARNKVFAGFADVFQITINILCSKQILCAFLIGD